MGKPGFNVLVAGQAVGGVREWCRNAAILLTAMDELWIAFCQAPEAGAGQIPMVSIATTVSVTRGSGAQKSTNYKPIFQMEGWVDCLAEFGKRSVPAPTASAPVPSATPSTASVAPLGRVGAPVGELIPARMPF
jgi:hypothetical protein